MQQLRQFAASLPFTHALVGCLQPQLDALPLRSGLTGPGPGLSPPPPAPVPLSAAELVQQLRARLALLPGSLLGPEEASGLLGEVAQVLLLLHDLADCMQRVQMPYYSPGLPVDMVVGGVAVKITGVERSR